MQMGTPLSNSELSFTAVLSPGGLVGANDDAAFDGSRAGASARYAYGRLDFRHQQAIGEGPWSWRVFGSAQVASGPLLGTEQLNGAGAAAVRAFRENVAFGDQGIVASAQLHMPRWSFAARHAIEPFVFIDAARLLQLGGAPDSSLAGAGLGLDYSFGTGMSLRTSYGRTLKRPDGYDGRDRWNISARVVF